ncbi:Trk system potassium transport protein TrkA [Alphaproteobacteria bacterium]|nr:Trk system potassium transport protein TrkA [Alphaproteobacteria bacterium]
MKILILGAGEVGRGIANHLFSQDEDVTIIEKSPEVAARIRESSGVNVVVGDAINIDVLKEANAENASYVIATMTTDEQNILACKLVGSLFEAKTKIARIKSDTFLHGDIFELFLKENFDVDIIIQPESDIANAVCDIAGVNGAFDVVDLESLVIVGLQCRTGAEVLNTPFRHFRGIVNLDASVLTITRNGKTFFPKIDDMLMDGDEIYVATTKAHMHEVLRLFGYDQKNKERILVVGGNKISISVIKTMLAKNPDLDVTLLEESMERAEEIAQNFPDITTSYGNYQNYDFLREIGTEIDMAIVLTGKEKTNILSSLFLKEIGVKRVLTLAKNHRYDVLLPIRAGCSVINPNVITIETVLHMTVRGGNIKSATTLKDCSATFFVVEAVVTESSSLVGNEVLSIELEDKIAPIFLVRNETIILAEKNPIVAAGDTIIIVAEGSHMKKCVPHRL